MKITVRINEFKRLLEEADYVVPKKAQMYILEFLKVDVRGIQATITAADLGDRIVQQFEVVDSSADGSFLVPCKKMRHFLKRHVGGTATIETHPETKLIAVTAGTFTMESKVPDAKDFRELWPLPLTWHEVSWKFLKRLIEQVESACPNKDQEKAVAAVKLESDGTVLRAIATDGYRICVAHAAGDFGVFNLLIPKSFLRVLKRRQGTTMRVGLSDCWHYFRTDAVLLECSKPPVKFPAWEKALTLDGWVSTVKTQATDLKAAIVTILSSVDERRPQIRLEVRGERLHLRASNDESGSTGFVNVSTEGMQEVIAKLNPAFITDFLAKADGEITIQFGDCIGSRFVKFSDDSRNYQYLMMPMKPDVKAETETECAPVASA